MKKLLHILSNICLVLGLLNLSTAAALTVRDQPDHVIISTDYFAVVVIEKKTGHISKIIPRELSGKTDVNAILPYDYDSGFFLQEEGIKTAQPERYSACLVSLPTPDTVVVVLNGLTQEKRIPFTKIFKIHHKTPVITLIHKIETTSSGANERKVYQYTSLAAQKLPPSIQYKIGPINITPILNYFSQIKNQPDFVQGNSKKLFALIQAGKQPGETTNEVRPLTLGANSKYFLSYYDDASSAFVLSGSASATTYDQGRDFQRATKSMLVSELGPAAFTTHLYCGTKKQRDLIYFKQTNDFHQTLAVDRTFPFGWAYRLAQWCFEILSFICPHPMLIAIFLSILMRLFLLKIQAYFKSPFFLQMTAMQKKHEDRVITEEQFQDQRAKLFLLHGMQAKLMPVYFAGLPFYLMLTIGIVTFLQSDSSIYGVRFLWLNNLASSDPYLILPIILLIQQAFYAHKNLKGSMIFTYLGLSLLVTPTLSAASLIIFIVGLLLNLYGSSQPIPPKQILVYE